MNIKFAFTLAEVLIVLGIIGLIADMTIPTLKQSIDEKVTATKLKKVHSTLENAFRMAVNDNGTPDEWGLTTPFNPDETEKIVNIFSKYLNMTKNCGKQPGCFPAGWYKFLNGSNWYPIDSTTNRNAKAQLADGTLIYVELHSPDCSIEAGDTLALKNSCGYIGVDVNGFKKPNTAGLDTFKFYYTKYGIVPVGTQTDKVYTFDNKCLNKTAGDRGLGCAAWVIYNENMDYLHCDGLAWDGSHYCQ